MARTFAGRSLQGHPFSGARPRGESRHRSRGQQPDGTERSAAALLDQINALATQLDCDAGAATGRDATRLRSPDATIKGRTATLR
jgi:hypothetical protein